MDAKNTCDGRRNDRSHMDYKGADDVQDAFSIVSVHDPIDEEDLNRLVKEGVIESKVIEYKKIFPNFSIPKDKKEFLADISSFANASGGDIIYGIQEDRGVPVSLCGLDILDAEIDNLKRQIEGVIRLNIGPRIPGISIQPIKLETGRNAIIIRIPKSWASPHMITIELKDHERFFSRTSSGKYPLDVMELRAAFMLSGTMAERIKNFRIDRIGNILSGETPVPMNDNPKIVLHVIPFTAFDLTKRLPHSSLEETVRKISPIFFDLSGYRCNVDGYLAYGGDPRTYYDGYLQLFRNGIIEVVGQAADKSDKMIPVTDFERQLYTNLPRYILAQKNLDLNLPILIAISLLNVNGCTIYVPRSHHFADQKIDRNVILLPESLIEHYEFNLDAVLKEILDVLWNASGFNGSPHFDDSGKWREIDW